MHGIQMKEVPTIQRTPMHDSTPLQYPETAKTFAIEVQNKEQAEKFASTHGRTDVAFMIVTKIIDTLRNAYNIPVMNSGSDTFTVDLARIPTAQGEPSQKGWEQLVKENFSPEKTGFTLREANSKKIS